MKEWQEFLAKLEIELGTDVVQKWVPNMARFDAANIYLETADSFQISWFEEHIRPRLKGFFNSNNRPIKVHLLSDKKGPSRSEAIVLNFRPDTIDPQMSFDHFIPSEKNLVTHKL